LKNINADTEIEALLNEAEYIINNADEFLVEETELALA